MPKTLAFQDLKLVQVFVRFGEQKLKQTPHYVVVCVFEMSRRTFNLN